MFKKFILSLTCIVLCISINAHPWKPSNYVIIDTDGGLDDMKAISMMLASHDVRVLAITVSPGALSAENTYIKVKSLLNSYHHEGIPVGINKGVKYKSPDYISALSYKWGDETGIDPVKAQPFISIIEQLLEAESTPVRFINLAGMSTAKYLIENSEIAKRQIKEFVWTADGITDKTGFNYNIDRQAANYMLEQTDFLISIVKPGTILFYDEQLISSIDAINTPYGKNVSEFLKSNIAKEHEFSLTAYDEMAPIFLHYPELFAKNSKDNITEFSPIDVHSLRNKAIQILAGETVKESQVISSLPTTASFYHEDIQPIVDEVINKYGHDEWFSGVIASELHRHLGVFAIIGVKMGIRAREYFCTGVDEFSALSYAGSTPPLSCMNDGIQVSTGATPGHGLLSVSNATPLSATVDFTYLGRTIRLSLKSDIQEQMLAELKEINYIYGLDSNIYWELVRKNTLKYWLQFDRHEIFTIQEL